MQTPPDLFHRSRAFRLCLVGACLALFASLAAKDLNLPGPQYDEASHAALTIDMLRPENPFSSHYTIRPFGQPFPFGTDPHTGATKAYIFFPFFLLFGPGVEVQRGVTVLMGVMALFFCYLLVKRAFGFLPAFWSVFLLGLDSSFIFYAKLDAGPIVEKLMWLMFCLWIFSEWGRSRNYGLLLLGLFGAVVGIYGHIAFIWFILAASVSALFFFRKEIVTLLGKREWWTLGGAGLVILLLFQYWLIGARDLLDLPVLNTMGVLAILERLATQGGIAPDVLGEYFKELVQTRPLTDLFFAFSLIFLICSDRSRPVKFIFTFMALLFVQMSFTPGAILPHRIMMLYIFFPVVGGIAVAKGLDGLTAKGKRNASRRFLEGAVLLMAAFSMIGQLLLTREVIRAVRQTEGTGPWSNEITHLADTLQQKEWRKVVCVDWGFRKNLFLLTKGKVLLEEPFWQWENEGKMEEDLIAMSRTVEEDTLFLLHPEVYWVGGYPTVQRFEEIIRQSGARAVPQKTFYEKRGKPVYFAYLIERSQ